MPEAALTFPTTSASGPWVGGDDLYQYGRQHGRRVAGGRRQGQTVTDSERAPLPATLRKC